MPPGGAEPSTALRRRDSISPKRPRACGSWPPVRRARTAADLQGSERRPGRRAGPATVAITLEGYPSTASPRADALDAVGGAVQPAPRSSRAPRLLACNRGGFGRSGAAQEGDGVLLQLRHQSFHLGHGHGQVSVVSLQRRESFSTLFQGLAALLLGFLGDLEGAALGFL